MFNFSFKEENMNYDMCVNISDTNILKSAGIVTNKYAIFVFFIWSPMISTVGVVGNILSIIILKQQFKNKRLYYMQLIVMTSDSIISIQILSSVFNPLLFYTTPGPNWIKSSFGLSFFSILQVVLANILVTTETLIILATNLDRLQVY